MKMHKSIQELPPRISDCLKVIYDMHERGQKVTTSAVRERLGVSDATVTMLFKDFAEAGWVQHTPYHGVRLTELGEQKAKEVIRHHRLLELYLARQLGYSWDRVHEEADKLEHVISEEFEDKIDALLGCPTVDPHGDPIPSKDGIIMAHSPNCKPGKAASFCASTIRTRKSCVTWANMAFIPKHA
jgi:DtxR family Mn-dependent transcriptional regulator